MKIVKSRADYGLLIKRVNETIKNEAKEQKCGFLRMFPMDISSSICHRFNVEIPPANFVEISSVLKDEFT